MFAYGWRVARSRASADVVAHCTLGGVQWARTRLSANRPTAAYISAQGLPTFLLNSHVWIVWSSACLQLAACRLLPVSYYRIAACISGQQVDQQLSRFDIRWVASPLPVASCQRRLSSPRKVYAVGKFSSKHAKFGPEIPLLQKLGVKLKFGAPIISSVGELQLPVPPYFLTHDSAGRYGAGAAHWRIQAR